MAGQRGGLHFGVFFAVILSSLGVAIVIYLWFQPPPEKLKRETQPREPVYTFKTKTEQTISTKRPVKTSLPIPKEGANQEICAAFRARLNPEGDYRIVAIAPDGKLVAGSVYGQNKPVELWNVETEKKIKSLKTELEKIQSLDISPDGRLLAIAGRETGSKTKPGVEVWNLKKYQIQFKVNGLIRRAMFSPDGKWLVTIHRDRVGVIDVTKGSVTQTFSRTGHYREAAPMSFSSNSRLLAFSHEKTKIKIVDLTNSKEEILGAHPGQVKALSFLDEDKTLASHGEFEREMKIWDLKKRKPMQPISLGSRFFVYEMILSPSARWCVLAGMPMPFYHVNSLKIHGQVFNPSTNTDIDLSENETLFAGVGAGSRGIWLWDIQFSRATHSLPIPEKTELMAISPDGTLIAQAKDHLIRILEVKTGKELVELAASGQIRGLTFSPDSQSLVSIDSSKKLNFWDVKQAKVKQSLIADYPESYQRRMTFSPDGKLLAFCDSGQARLLKSDSKEEIKLGPEAHDTLSLSFSKDGSLLALGSSQGILRIKNLNSGKVIGPIIAHEEKVLSVAFSPDGSMVASSGDDEDRTIAIWDAKAGKEIITIPEAHGYVEIPLVVFTPDGKSLLSVGGDYIKCWDVKTGKLLSQTSLGRCRRPKTFLGYHDKYFLTFSKERANVWEREKLTPDQSNDRPPANTFSTKPWWDFRVKKSVTTLQQEYQKLRGKLPEKTPLWTIAHTMFQPGINGRLTPEKEQIRLMLHVDGRRSLSALASLKAVKEHWAMRLSMGTQMNPEHLEVLKEIPNLVELDFGSFYTDEKKLIPVLKQIPSLKRIILDSTADEEEIKHWKEAFPKIEIIKGE